MKRYFLVMVFLIGFLGVKASNRITTNDSIQISLLTCAPGDIIYTLFGHSAIRVHIPSADYDMVYNYGIFDFSSDNFIWRFTLGETDYILGKYPFDYFMSEYIATDRAVWEQKIDLDQTEKWKLYTALEENYMPANRVYRYNFFYDNCATRPYHKINEAVGHKLRLTDSNETTYSFRSLIHRYTREYPWSEFGIDLCLGSDADKTVGVYEKIFIPIELMNELEKVSKTGEVAIGPIETLYEPDEIDENSGLLTYLTPIRLFTALLLIIAVVSGLEFKRRIVYWGIDAILFPIYGIAGCILCFISFLSVHPTVSPNYILFLFHPFHLIFAPYIIKGEIKGAKIWYHNINFIVLSLFLIGMPLIPQSFSLAIVPLAGILWLRSLNYILIRRTKKQ